SRCSAQPASATYEGWVSVWFSARWSTSPSLVPGSSEPLHAASAAAASAAATAIRPRPMGPVSPLARGGRPDHGDARTRAWVPPGARCAGRRSGDGDLRGEVTGPVAVVDIDHGHTRGAGVEHGQEGRDPREGCAVAHGGGHGDDGGAHQARDDAGQRAV